MRNNLITLDLMLLAGCMLWYFIRLRMLYERGQRPDIRRMNQKQREAFVQGPEYQRLRNMVRIPIFTTLVLGIILLFLLQAPS